MTQNKIEIDKELIKIKDQRFDIRNHFSLIFANFLAKLPAQHEKIHIIDELVTEETCDHHLDKNNYTTPYVLIFYAHKPQSSMVSPYYPDEPRAHSSLLLCKVNQGKINQVLNIDGYDFPAYVDLSSNKRINQRLIIKASSPRTSKTPLQKSSWDNMNCLLFAFTFASRILELFNSTNPNLDQLMTNLPLLESEILEGLVDKYVNKAGLNYCYDQNLTMNYHTQFRQQIGTSFLNQSMQISEELQQQATLNAIDKKSTLKNNLNSSLDLREASLMPITSEKIAKETHKTSLSLVASGLTDEDVGIICEYLNDHPEITSLNLGSNKISAKGAEALAAIKTLKQLDLSWNLIGDTGAKALAINNTLISLELTGTGISDEGAKALAENKKLSLLNLSHNKIKDEGAQALARNQTLLTLKINHNQINKLGSEALNNRAFSFLDLLANNILISENQINARQGYKTETTQAVQQKNQNPRKTLSEPHQKFNEAISVVADKMVEFTRRPQFSNNLELLQAYAAAEKLKIALEKEGELYFSTPPTAKGLKQFQSNCRKHLIEAKLTLDEHRGWKKIVLNVFAIIVTAGVGYALAAGINIAVKGRFTFFSTDSSEKLAGINDHVKNISPKSN